MSDEKTFYEQFSGFMNQNIRGVQYGIYSIAGLGLVIALRSVRPFAKFSLPGDIPSHFIQKRMPFVGRVVGVQPSSTPGGNPLVLVDHRPLIKLPKKYNSNGLPLEISSVNVTSNGFMWLQSVLSNEEITFVPLKTSSDRVHSVVIKKSQNIGHQLVKIGFATVSPIEVTLERDQYYVKYYKSLIAAEKKAETKGLGLWSDSKIPFSKLFINRFKNLLPFSF